MLLGIPLSRLDKKDVHDNRSHNVLFRNWKVSGVSCLISLKKKKRMERG